jgi:hypothetical protein
MKIYHYSFLNNCENWSKFTRLKVWPDTTINDPNVLNFWREIKSMEGLCIDFYIHFNIYKNKKYQTC